MPGEYYRSLRRSGLWRSCEGTEPLLSAIKKEGKLIEQEKSRDDSGGSSSASGGNGRRRGLFLQLFRCKNEKKEEEKEKSA